MRKKRMAIVALAAASALMLLLTGCGWSRRFKAVSTLRKALTVAFHADRTQQDGKEVFYFTDQNGISFTYYWLGDSFTHASWSCDYADASIEAQLDQIDQIIAEEGAVTLSRPTDLFIGMVEISATGEENRATLLRVIERILEEVPEIQMDADYSLYIRIPTLSAELYDESGERIDGGLYTFYCQGDPHLTAQEIADRL